MDAESRRRFVNSMMAATAAAMGGGAIFGGMPLFGQQSTIPDGAPRRGRGSRARPVRGPHGGPESPSRRTR